MISEGDLHNTTLSNHASAKKTNQILSARGFTANPADVTSASLCFVVGAAEGLQDRNFTKSQSNGGRITFQVDFFHGNTSLSLTVSFS